MRAYKIAFWLVWGVWLVFCLATLDYNGPFFDEGIYITAGQRTLEGHGITDGYLAWFGGSLLWPVGAALGYNTAGLVGARALAVLTAAVAFLALARSTENLFGPGASFWAALTFALSGPFLAFARLAVYDGLALAGIAVSFWAVTKLHKSDDRMWLAISAVSFMLGTIAKYPMALMVLPILGILLCLRQQKAKIDIPIFAFISAAIGLAFYLPAREQLGQFLSWRLQNKPSFGVLPKTIGFAIFYLSAAPACLAVAGWLVARQRRWMGGVLLMSLAIWPAYHLALEDPVGKEKHLVFGFLFAYPLVGLAMSALWERRKGRPWLHRAAALAIAAALAALGLLQLSHSDPAWPDARPAADYLTANVQPGDRLLIDESWPYTMYLYTEGRIQSPWDVVDAYRMSQGQSEIDLCAYDWFVNSQGSYRWSEAILSGVAQCGTFEQVFDTTDIVVGLGADLDYVRYPVQIVIWRNSVQE